MWHNYDEWHTEDANGLNLLHYICPKRYIAEVSTDLDPANIAALSALSDPDVEFISDELIDEEVEEMSSPEIEPSDSTDTQAIDQVSEQSAQANQQFELIFDHYLPPVGDLDPDGTTSNIQGKHLLTM